MSSNMTTADALREIREMKVGAGKCGDDKTIEALELAETALMALSTYFGMQVEDKAHTGCAYCRHRDEEPFNYPCYACKRNMQDYFEEEK